ncbi:MAG TPA: caspase family protein [Burkholderiales bacterium]|nr:caspase family protein [Burkholderiales bacterium]
MSARSDKKAMKMLLTRRQWLTRMTALASSTALPLWLPSAWAQADPALSSLPRRALVIGNARYARAALSHSVNDANAIGGALQKHGFQLSLQLNAGRTQMVEAIRDFARELANRKSVGFFYFAGHGGQFESRNYLMPVDASIGSPAHLPDMAVELNSLLQALTAAGNPLNAVVLDACRDYPFNHPPRGAQRGLAQFDAPPGALLAYATTPGNTTTDGMGGTGLYAGHLLRELAVPAASIQDVFKRLRLSVRRDSNGRQVPWESTSLDDEFYFQARATHAQRSRKELEQQFEAELESWEKARSSRHAAALEEYLRCYPGGAFCELAQFRIERLFAQQPRSLPLASVAQNPFSKGTSRADDRFSVGDSYTYRTINMLSNAPEDQYIETVTGVTGSGVVFNGGESVIDLLGNDLKGRLSNLPSSTQFYPAEYAMGRKWTARLEKGGEITFKVAGKEPIAVPAGTFEAFRIEGAGYGAGGVRWKINFWVAPEISRRPIALDFMMNNGARYVVAERRELREFRQMLSPAPDSHRMHMQMAQRLDLCNRDTAGSGLNYCHPLS